MQNKAFHTRPGTLGGLIANYELNVLFPIALLGSRRVNSAFAGLTIQRGCSKMNVQTQHKIVRGDSRCMTELRDKSIQLVITSPPYWQLKDYGIDEQIGFNDSYENYINNLNLVWKECYRVLDNGCRLCVNIGDQFARSVYYGRYKVIPIRTEIIKFCESIGFDYMGAIIWQKKTTTNTTGGASIMGSFPFPRNGIQLIMNLFYCLKNLAHPHGLIKQAKNNQG